MASNITVRDGPSHDGLRHRLEGESPILSQSTSAALHHFEETLVSLNHRGRASARKLANRVSDAAHDMEQALYYAAHELSGGGRALITYDALPTLWRNNNSILSGYRFIPADNWPLLLQSIFRWHNETGNIYTHMAGLGVVVVLHWFSGKLDADATPMDRWVQTTYLVAAAKSLACSVTWHVMAGCSDIDWFQRFACLDYTGISGLVAASLLTLVYNGFYCQPYLIALYSVGVFCLGMSMGLVPWAAWFDNPKNRTIRISLFIGMAVAGLVPFTHLVFIHGLRKTFDFFAPAFLSVLSYAVGVAVYAMRFPEKYAPGRYDYVGHSHQFWHVSIVLAIILHYRAITLMHADRVAFSQLDGTCPFMPWPAVLSKLGIPSPVPSFPVRLDTYKTALMAYLGK